MSRSNNWYIAAIEGPQFTLYAVCKLLGVPLSESQEKFQQFLEGEYGEKGGKNETPTIIRPQR